MGTLEAIRQQGIPLAVSNVEMTLRDRLTKLAEDPRKKNILDLHVASSAHAERFRNAWERQVGEPETPEIVGNAYNELGLENAHVSGFARLAIALEFVNHLSSPNSHTAIPPLSRYGIYPEVEQAGIFDPTADMITLEENLMKGYCQKITRKSSIEERESLQVWVNEFVDRYGVYPSYYNTLKNALDGRDLKEHMRDLPRSLRDLVVKNFYDENATIGHIINSVGGWLFMSNYVHLFAKEVSKEVQLGAMGGFLALVFIGSLNLPNRAVDKETEGKANKVLTFAPTIGIGLISGMIAPEYPTLALLSPLIATIMSGGMAYWYQGQMSRRHQITDLQQKGIFGRYPILGDFVAKVGAPQFHVRADRLLRTMTSQKSYWRAVHAARHAGEAIGTSETEIQEVLADIRSYLRVDTKELVSV